MIAFFRRIRKVLINSGHVRKYLIYAVGEIALVVIGILIALQVNNWNQIRIENERFEFGLKQIHSEIQSSQFYQSGLADKLDFQLLRIDSLLQYPDEIPISRIPPILIILDQYGLDLGRGYEEKIQLLQINSSNKKYNTLSTRLQFYLRNINQITYPLESMGLNYAMAKYLRSYNIPLKPFNHGPTYEDFIKEYIHDFYNSSYDNNIKALISDKSFRADLKTLKQIKQEEKISADLRGFDGKNFIQFIQSEVKEIDYSLNYMEVVGTGTQNDNWSEGISMNNISKDGTKWEVELNLKDGEIKFRSDIQWILDWGRGEDNKELLVFKGGDISVSEGFYQITIDIAANSYEIIPIDKTR